MKKDRAFLAAFALAGVSFDELYRFIFCRRPGLLVLTKKKTHSKEYYEKRDRLKAELLKRPRTEYFIRDGRGQRLVGYYYCAGEKPAGRFVFIVHGYRSDHAETAGPIADYYFSRGWDVFACDHASHGDSQGRLIGYDYYESLACLEWLDILRRAYGRDTKVILHGFSMGGGTVLKMSDRVPDNVKFIVSDSGFTDAVAMIKPSLGPIYPLIRGVNRLIAGYDIEETDVRGNLKNAKVPILFVHGTADPTVPFSMGEELYALCPTEKDCLFTDGVLHIESIYRAPELYAEKMDRFIKLYVDDDGKDEKDEI